MPAPQPPHPPHRTYPPHPPGRPDATRAAATSLRLAAWFLLGLVASVPAALGYGALRPATGPEEAASVPQEPAPIPVPTVRVPPSPQVMARVDALCQKGYAFLQEERFAEAFEEFSRAAALDPFDPRPPMGLGEASRKLDYEELAEAHYRRAILLDPTFREPRERLVMILYDFGRHDEALAILEGLERETPESPFVVGELAINALRLGDTEKAVRLLERYNRIAGRDAWGFEQLGRAHADAGRHEEAERAYREAIRIHPRSATAHLWLGQTLRLQGRKEEADKELQIFQRLRDLQTRARFLEQDMNRNPDHLPTLMGLAQTRVDLGRYKEALVPLDRALRIAPGDARIRELRDAVVKRAEETAGR